MIELARRLELGAVNAYLGVIPRSRIRLWPRLRGVWRRMKPCIGHCSVMLQVSRCRRPRFILAPEARRPSAKSVGHNRIAHPMRLHSRLPVLILFGLPAVSSLAAGMQQTARAVRARCGGCHAVDANRVGPLHRNVFGWKAGSASGYDYSSALRKSTVRWDDATLDAGWPTRKIHTGTTHGLLCEHAERPWRHHRFFAQCIGTMNAAMLRDVSPSVEGAMTAAMNCLPVTAGRGKRKSNCRAGSGASCARTKLHLRRCMRPVGVFMDSPCALHAIPRRLKRSPKTVSGKYGARHRAFIRSAAARWHGCSP